MPGRLGWRRTWHRKRDSLHSVQDQRRQPTGRWKMRSFATSPTIDLAGSYRCHYHFHSWPEWETADGRRSPCNPGHFARDCRNLDSCLGKLLGGGNCAVHEVVSHCEETVDFHMQSHTDKKDLQRHRAPPSPPSSGFPSDHPAVRDEERSPATGSDSRNWTAFRCSGSLLDPDPTMDGIGSAFPAELPRPDGTHSTDP